MVIRIDKYLADMGYGTRTEVKKYLKNGLVRIDNNIIKDAKVKVDTDVSEVYFDNKLVGYEEFEYYMLNKPAGVISASEDKNQKTVVDLIEDKKRKDLFPVGRLDKDTEGLLIITNDGALAYNLLSPTKHVDKVYFTKVDGKVTDEHVKMFAEGLQVEEDFKALPADIEILEYNSDENITSLNITIKEGKFHQIKRMFKTIDMEVLYLKRLSMGNLHLDKELALGEYRNLTQEELELLKNTGNLLKGKKAVIFDLDGTLVDSMWIWKQIDIEYLAKFDTELPDDLQKEIEGMSFTETAHYFKKRFSIPDDIDKMKADWNRMAWDKYANDVMLKKGAKEFLEYLKANGIKTGIATSNSRELVDLIVEKREISKYIDTITTSCEVNAGKPAPDIYLKVAKDLGVKVSECLVFEDIISGIMAGKNAGMSVCAVYDDYSNNTKDEIKKLADFYIDDFYEVLNKL